MRSKQRKPEVAQRRADRATGLIIELIQHLVFALDDAVVAIMYHIPAKYAEPDEALKRLSGVKQRFGQVVNLIEEVKKPLDWNAIEKLKLKYGKRSKSRT